MNWSIFFITAFILFLTHLIMKGVALDKEIERRKQIQRKFELDRILNQ
jgi:hypothetical protein